MTWFVVILFVMLVLLTFTVLAIMHKRRDKDMSLCKTINAFQFDQSFNNLKSTEPIMSPYKEVIDANHYSIVREFADANLIFFSDYSYIDQKIRNIPFRPSCPKYYIYAICGSDEMASKSSLAVYLKAKGYDYLLPRTYVLNDRHDLQSLRGDHVDGTVYMVKKNVQRQEGNLITGDIEYILKSSQDDYVVCQELLQDPYLVGGRKINMRVYMLVVSYKGETRFYMYNNGFMYYTPGMFQKGSSERDINITTGYIDRKVYQENPLTIQDFLSTLDDADAYKLVDNMKKALGCVREAYADVLTSLNQGLPGVKFNVYGVDIAPDENLGVKIMEINKGPDLTYKDERDKAVKLNMVFDMFAMVGLRSPDKDKNKNFLRL